MEFLSIFFNTILYRPLFNLLILFYEYLPGHDFGIAIISLTLFIKILLYPLAANAIKIQKNMQNLQPKIKEIQQKHKNNKEKLALETLELYKREKINPFTSLFVSLAQVPVLIALWLVFLRGFDSEKMKLLYSFVPWPEIINMNFLGIINLAEPSMAFAVLAGISQFFQAKTMSTFSKKTKNIKEDKKENKKEDKNNMPDFSKIMEKQILYFFPIFTVFILLKLPSALALYWLVTAIFSVTQQYFILNKEKELEIK